jgi:hypothetical protein
MVLQANTECQPPRAHSLVELVVARVTVLRLVRLRKPRVEGRCLDLLARRTGFGMGGDSGQLSWKRGYDKRMKGRCIIILSAVKLVDAYDVP